LLKVAQPTGGGAVAAVRLRWRASDALRVGWDRRHRPGGGKTFFFLRKRSKDLCTGISSGRGADVQLISCRTRKLLLLLPIIGLISLK
jgi:hypothetical protein